MVTGPLRAVAARAVNRDSVNRLAAQSLIGMVNRLPEEKTAGAAKIAANLADTALRGSPATAQLIGGVLDRCNVKVRYQMYPHLRACLGNQHDLFNAVTTQSVWRALRAGS
jgi:hypothetical protein